MSVSVATARPTVLLRSSPSLILAALAFILGAIYAWVVQPGLPYDEPSHWATVLFYADNTTLPVLGDEGVTYEAQMGPVAYVLDATVVRVARAADLSVAATFHLVRLVGAAEFAVAVVLVGRLAKRLLGPSWATTAAVGLFALNPMLLTMSSSVQNDTLALVLGLLALELTLARLADRSTVRWATLVGVVAALALLTKLTTWTAVVAIAAWLLWRHRFGALRALVAFAATVTAITAWWFVRNIVLYGDPTAAAGVRRTGVSFDTYHASNAAAALGHIIQELVTYLWLPTEYARNLISAPTLLKGALLTATVAVVVFSVRRLRLLREPARSLILGCGVLSIASWLFMYFVYQSVGPRAGYLFLPMWTGLVVLALTHLRASLAVAAGALTIIALNSWTLYELSHVPPHAFISL
jgi:hypothetical protein